MPDDDKYTEYLSKNPTERSYALGNVGALHKHADAAASAHRFTEAVDLYTRLLEREPRIEAYVNRGSCYCRLGEYTKAIADFEAALRLDPDEQMASIVYNNRGMALRHLDADAAALRDIDKAIGLNAQYAEAHYNKAELLVKMGSPVPAINSYKEFLAFADPVNHPHHAELQREAQKKLQNLTRVGSAWANDLSIPESAEAAASHRHSPSETVELPRSLEEQPPTPTTGVSSLPPSIRVVEEVPGSHDKPRKATVLSEYVAPDHSCYARFLLARGWVFYGSRTAVGAALFKIDSKSAEKTIVQSIRGNSAGILPVGLRNEVLYYLVRDVEKPWLAYLRRMPHLGGDAQTITTLKWAFEDLILDEKHLLCLQEHEILCIADETPSPAPRVLSKDGYKDGFLAADAQNVFFTGEGSHIYRIAKHGRSPAEPLSPYRAWFVETSRMQANCNFVLDNEFVYLYDDLVLKRIRRTGGAPATVYTKETHESVAHLGIRGDHLYFCGCLREKDEPSWGYVARINKAGGPKELLFNLPSLSAKWGTIIDWMELSDDCVIFSAPEHHGSTDRRLYRLNL